MRGPGEKAEGKGEGAWGENNPLRTPTDDGVMVPHKL